MALAGPGRPTYNGRPGAELATGPVRKRTTSRLRVWFGGNPPSPDPPTRRRMRPALPFAALTGLVALGACTDKAATGTRATKASASAVAYVNTAVAFEDTVFIPAYHSRVNFPSVLSAALDSVNRTGSQGPGRDTLYFGPVEYTIDPFLRKAGDQHSDYFPPSEAPGSSDANPSDPRVNLSGSMLGAGAGVRTSSPVAYLWYPAFEGTNNQGHVDSTHALIRSLDQNSPCGYVLDLRYNYGGSIFPMVAGLSPLMGNAVITGSQNGLAGWGVDYEGSTYRLYSLNGGVGISVNGLSAGDSIAINPLSHATNPYTLQRPNTPVAILTDTVSASAAEFITLSFRGGSVPFRTFGTGTFGVTTTPYHHQFADSGFLNIAAALMMDRTGHVYGGSLLPDQRVTDNRFVGFTSAGKYYNKFTPAQASTTPDSMVQAAVAWLNTQPSCGGTATAVRAPNYARDASGIAAVGGTGIRLRRPAPISRVWMARRPPVSRAPLYFLRKR